MTARSASNEPWMELSVYIIPPKVTKRSVGESISRRKLPRSVWCWLMENAITGISIIMLCTMDSVISHPGTGPPTRWWPPTCP
ncbi:hypothetical protein D3C85_1189180 [compost metagenome]